MAAGQRRLGAGTRQAFPRGLKGKSLTVWLGIDLGTQGCRAMGVDDEGRVISSAVSPLASARHQGRHEQDPESWRTAVSVTCRQVIAGLRGRPISGVAICGTSGSFLVADRAGRPLTPALMYDDSRAVTEYPRVADAWAACGTRNGYRVQATWALPKLLWTLRNVSGAEKGRLYHVADFIGSWLANEAVPADNSSALKTGYDLLAARWPTENFEAVGIPPSVLPPVVGPGTTVGRVSPKAAAATGLAVGTPIVAGMTDGCASQIASGAVRVGQWNSALGTTLTLKGVSSHLLRDDSGAVYSHAHPDQGWLPGGASNSGAGVLEAVFPGANLAQMDGLSAPYAPTEVLRYPLSRPGERFPFIQPDAEPFMVGVPRDDAELYAALLQGVAFVERLSFAYVRVIGAVVNGPVALTGGATRSAQWNQLRVDVLGRDGKLPCHPDSAVGMAIVAASGRGSVVDASDRMVHTCTQIEPRPDRTAAYSHVYAKLVAELERRGYIDATFATAALGDP